jgi:hypothetical protein
VRQKARQVIKEKGVQGGRHGIGEIVFCEFVLHVELKIHPQKVVAGHLPDAIRQGV